jgi:hypothetical protein
MTQPNGDIITAGTSVAVYEDGRQQVIDGSIERRYGEYIGGAIYSNGNVVGYKVYDNTHQLIEHFDYAQLEVLYPNMTNFLARELDNNGNRLEEPEAIRIVKLVSELQKASYDLLGIIPSDYSDAEQLKIAIKRAYKGNTDEERMRSVNLINAFLNDWMKEATEIQNGQVSRVNFTRWQEAIDILRQAEGIVKAGEILADSIDSSENGFRLALPPAQETSTVSFYAQFTEGISPLGDGFFSFNGRGRIPADAEVEYMDPILMIAVQRGAVSPNIYLVNNPVNMTGVFNDDGTITWLNLPALSADGLETAYAELINAITQGNEWVGQVAESALDALVEKRADELNAARRGEVLLMRSL